MFPRNEIETNIMNEDSPEVRQGQQQQLPSQNVVTRSQLQEHGHGHGHLQEQDGHTPEKVGQQAPEQTDHEQYVIEDGKMMIEKITTLGPIPRQDVAVVESSTALKNINDKTIDSDDDDHYMNQNNKHTIHLCESAITRSSSSSSSLSQVYISNNKTNNDFIDDDVPIDIESPDGNCIIINNNNNKNHNQNSTSTKNNNGTYEQEEEEEEEQQQQQQLHWKHQQPQRICSTLSCTMKTKKSIETTDKKEDAVLLLSYCQLKILILVFTTLFIWVLVTTTWVIVLSTRTTTIANNSNNNNNNSNNSNDNDNTKNGSTPTPTPTPTPTLVPATTIKPFVPINGTGTNHQQPSSQQCGSATTFLIPPFPGKKGIGMSISQMEEDYILYTSRTDNNNHDNNNTNDTELLPWEIKYNKILQLDVYWHYNWGLRRIPTPTQTNENQSSSSSLWSSVSLQQSSTNVWNQQQQHENYIPLLVPMAWDGGHSESALRKRFVDNDIITQINNGTITHLFGFNEPDRIGQANMDVEIAIERWKVLEQLIGQQPTTNGSSRNSNSSNSSGSSSSSSSSSSSRISLISPSCGNPSSVWMNQFMKQVDELCLRVDAIGVHWYGPPNATKFQIAMTRYYTMYGSKRPISITEFAVADWTAVVVVDTNNTTTTTTTNTTTATATATEKQQRHNNKHSIREVLAFMKEALPWLERTEWIHSYAWFPFDANDPVGWSSALFTTTTTWNGYSINNNTSTSTSSTISTLTPVGRYYKSVSNINPDGDQTIECQYCDS